MFDQVAGPVASFTADGAYDQDRVYARVAERYPGAAVVVPPRANAVPSNTAETTPTQRDGHVQHIARHGRMSWQSASGYNTRAWIEATMNRWKQVVSMPIESSPNVPIENSPLRCGSVASVATRWFDVGEFG